MAIILEFWKIKWLTVFLQQVVVKLAVLLALHWRMIIFNSLGRCTSLGSPVVGLPPFSLWTGVFCSISSADDRTDLCDSVPRASLVRAGEDGVWVGEIFCPLQPIILYRRGTCTLKKGGGDKNDWRKSRWKFSEQPGTTFLTTKRMKKFRESLRVEPVDDKPSRYKSNWLHM